MKRALWIAAVVFLGGCGGFRHCTEFATDRDEVKAPGCEAKCRCIPSEDYRPGRIPKVME